MLARLVTIARALWRVLLLLSALGLLATATSTAAQEAATAGPGTAAPSGASGGGSTFSSDADALMKTERFRHLTGELRCLVCQNQSLVDSNAPLAQDLRVEVVKLMASGRNDREIKSFLVDRYGEFVLYRPALSLRNSLLWVGPFALLLIGLVAWWRLGRRRPAAPRSAQDALKHVDELLGR
jgi:cytochrome c-type biogenesis protein CcmH